MLHRLLLALALLCLPLMARAQAQDDAGFLARQIESALSSDGQQVRISGFQGALSSTATMTSLTVADADGIWLRASNIQMHWNRAALLARRVDIRELSVGEITILRPPLAQDATPSPEATPFALPQLPVSVNVGSLDIARITLGAPLLGQEIALTLSGNIALNSGAVNTRLSASRIDGRQGDFSLIAAYNESSRVLSLVLKADEAADGLIANLAGLPGKPSLSVQIAGSGPIDDYRATLLLATDGTTRLTGEATLAATPGGGHGFGLRAQGDVSSLVLPDYRDFFGPLVRLGLDGEIGADRSIDIATLALTARALDLTGNARITPDGWPERITLAGQIGQTGSRPVTLPFGGGDIAVGRVILDVDYDAAAGDAWLGTFGITELSMPALTLPDLALTGSGRITPRRGDTPGSLTVDLGYAASGLALADPALAQAIGTDITGELRLSRAADGPVRIGLLTVEGPGLGVEAEGTIAGAAEDFLAQTSATLRADDLSRFSALAGRPLAGAAEFAVVSSVEPLNGIFDAIVTGTTRDIALGLPHADALLAGEGALTLAARRDETGTRVTGLDFTTPALAVTASADITSTDSRATFDIRLPDAAVALPDLPGPASLSGTLTRDPAGALALDAQARATGVNAAIDATMAPPDAGGEIIGSVLAEVADLSTFADLAGRPLSGGGEVMLSGQLSPDLASFDVTALGRTRDLAIGIPQVDALLAGEGKLDGRVTRTGPQSLRLTDVRVTTDALFATATGDLTPEGGTADLDIRLADVAPFLPGLSGPATLTGTAAPDATGATSLALDATAPGATARIDGTLAPDLTFDGSIAARVPDLAPYGALAGQPLSGGIDLTAQGRVAPDLSDLDLRLSGTTDNLQTGIAQIDPLLRGPGRVAVDIAGGWPAALTIRNLSASTPGMTLSGDGAFTDGAGTASLRLDVPDIAPVAPGFSGPARITASLNRDAAGLAKVEAALSGPATTAKLTATIKPPEFGYHTDFTLTADAADLSAYRQLTGRPLGGSVSGTLKGSVTPGADAFDLTFAGRATNLDPGDPTAAALLRGTGTVGGRVSIGTDSRLRVRDLDIRFPNLTVTGDVGGSRTGGEGRIDARIADLGIIAPGFSGPATLKGTGSLDARGIWRVQADATGPGGTTARIGGTIGPDLQLGLTAKGSAPLGLANSFIDPNRMTGTAAFDLQVKGPPRVESVSGTVTLQDATLTIPTAGQSLQAINGTVKLAAGQANVNVTASPEQGGRIAATGSVGLTPPFTAALDLRGDGIVLRDPDLYDTTIDAALRITGPLTGGAVISGAVDVGTTELRIPTSAFGLGGNLPVVSHVFPSVPVVETLARAGLTTAGVPVAEGSHTGSGRFDLDIVVRAPSRVFIRGRGLDAEMGGEVTIRGNTANPVPTGSIRLIRGRLDILQQRFQLTEGEVDLRGGFDPIIRLVAKTTTRTGIAAIITVEGDLTEPTLTVSSIPDLPQDEVLAQLLFGRRLSSITPLQAIQLASAIATLSGRGSIGVIEGFRNRLGIDNFDVTTDDRGNAAVQAGIYLTDRIYTEAIVSADETEINLNFDVSRDVTVRGSVTSDGDNAIGIYFERDY